MLRVPRRTMAVLGAAVLSLAVGLVSQAPPTFAASLTEVTDFGTNPSQLQMYVYRPAGAPARPALVVAVHYCHGTGPAFFSGSGLAPLADRYGFVMIFPSVTQASDDCFDVASPAALRRGGGSDPVGIQSMVAYAQQNYGVDPGRVYAMGVSSGAMMTNVLLGDYPDVYQAGAAFAGVPFGCFAGSNSWNSDCANGLITRTGQQWGDQVRAAYPGYNGPRPRIQLWHGTNDTTLNFHNFGEEIKQWTDVLGVSQTPTSTDTPASGQTRTRYANGSGAVQVEAYSLAGVPHNLPVDSAAAIHFFGLDGSTPTASPTSSPTVSPSASQSPSVTPSSSVSPSASPSSWRTCSAAFSVANAWNGGFVGSVRVTAGSTAISRWTVALSLPSGTSITNLWNGQLTGTSVASAGWNSSVQAEGSVEFGFQGSGPATGVGVSSCTAA